MNHSFDVEDAKRYGVNAALLLASFRHWVKLAEGDESHMHEGRCWVYKSRRELQEAYPYLSDSQIRTALDKLIEGGALLKGNFNRVGFDRTVWYAVGDQRQCIGADNQCIGADNQCIGADNQCIGDERQPIPVTDTVTDTVTISAPPAARACGSSETYTEAEDKGWARFVETYKANIGQLPTSEIGREQIADDFEKLGAEIMSEAVRQAALAYPTNAAQYFARVCGSWIEDGIKTIEQAKARAAPGQRGGQKQAYKGGVNRGRNDPSSDRTRIPGAVYL